MFRRFPLPRRGGIGSFAAEMAAYLVDTEAVDYLRLPGVRVQEVTPTAEGDVATILTVPNNAVDVISDYLDRLGAQGVRAQWLSYYGAPKELSLDDVEAAIQEAPYLKPLLRGKFLADYQKDALRFSLSRPGALLEHPAGTGKTVTSILWALLGGLSAEAAYTTPIVAVTKTPVVRQWAAAVSQFTTLTAYPWVSASSVRKRRDKFHNLQMYLGWCAENNQTPVIVVGWENMSDKAVYSQLISLKPQAVILDESQKAKSKKRTSAVPLAADDVAAIKHIKARGGWVKAEADGSMTGFVPNENIAKATELLCRAAPRRLAATATPIHNLPEDWWAQLDNLEPGAWGSFSEFALRYCDAKPGVYTKFDTKGSSNEEELAERLKQVRHAVAASVARSQLPAMRRESLYIEVEDQCEPGTGFSDREYAKREREGGKTSITELRIFEAAARKRKGVINRVSEHVEAGHKIVIFTGRHKDCEALGDTVKAAFKKIPVLVCHGGHGASHFAECKRAYIESDGPIILVGTGDLWGTGVDGLQCTDAAFFVMLPYKPGDLEQWEGRFIRLGQKGGLIIYYVVAVGTYDERLVSIQLDKLEKQAHTARTGALEGASDALSGLGGKDGEAVRESILDLLMQGDGGSFEEEE